MFSSDVSTGTISTIPASNTSSLTNSTTYGTTGPPTSLTNTLNTFTIFETSVKCYLWDVLETCTPEQTAMIADGSAVFEDWVLVGYKLADGTVSNGTGSMLGNGTGTSSIGTASGATTSATATASDTGVAPYKGAANQPMTATGPWLALGAALVVGGQMMLF